MRIGIIGYGLKKIKEWWFYRVNGYSIDMNVPENIMATCGICNNQFRTSKDDIDKLVLCPLGHRTIVKGDNNAI